MLHWIRRAALGAAAIALTSLGVAPKAEASLRLSLQDLSTGAMVVITETTDGFVNFNGVVGSWIVNVATGTSTPLLQPDDMLDLNSINVSGAAGTIRIILEDDGYSENTGNVVAHIGGTTTGTVEASGWYNSTNATPALGADVGSPGAVRPIVDAGTTAGGLQVFNQLFNSGAFSTTKETNVGAKTNPYSMYMQVDITHTAAGQISSFDFSLTNTPEPGTLAVAMSGLPLLFFAWRRHKRNA